MALVLVGVSFNDIPLAELEQLERHTDQIRQTLLSDSSESNIRGGVVVGTCNRFEIYLDADRFHATVDQVIRVISGVTGWPADYCRESFNAVSGQAATEHLFAVSSGLESMVIGEVEIAGQVKDALRLSQKAGQTTKLLEQVFQRASRVAKNVITNTSLASAGKSVISVALDLAQQRHGQLAGKRALLLGTGAYARVCVSALQSLGLTDIAVYSARGRAPRFSQTHNTRAIDTDELASELAKVDIVIAASGVRNHLIDRELIEHSGLNSIRTEQNPLAIIDVALSADVSIEVASMNTVDLINLEVIRQHVPQEHTEAEVVARAKVADAAKDFTSELDSQVTEPAILALREHFASAVDREVERVRLKSGDVAALAARESLQRLAKSLLHAPTLRIKEGLSESQLDELYHSIETLFGIAVGDVK